MKEGCRLCGQTLSGETARRQGIRTCKECENAPRRVANMTREAVQKRNASCRATRAKRTTAQKEISRAKARDRYYENKEELNARRRKENTPAWKWGKIRKQSRAAEAARRKRNPPPDKLCSVCEKKIEDKRLRFCSDDCRREAKNKARRVANITEEQRKKKNTENRASAKRMESVEGWRENKNRLARERRARERPPLENKECPICGKVFKHLRKKYCTDACRSEARAVQASRLRHKNSQKKAATYVIVWAHLSHGLAFYSGRTERPLSVRLQDHLCSTRGAVLKAKGWFVLYSTIDKMKNEADAAAQEIKNIREGQRAWAGRCVNGKNMAELLRMADGEFLET